MAVALNVMFKNKEVYLPSLAEHKTDSEVSFKQGKFFDLVDTYTNKRDQGTPVIIRMKPESHLILFSYATSQETFEYGVYNYKTNQMFMGIGYSGIDGGDSPIAIIGNDKLLEMNIDDNAKPNSPAQTFSVVDFHNKIIAPVPVVGTTNPAFEYYHEVYGNDGYWMVTLQDTQDFIPGKTKYKTYKLDEKAFQLNEYN